MDRGVSSGEQDHDPLQQRVVAEHTRLLFESSWASGATAPAVVAILCWVLWPYVNHGWLAGWWALKFAVAVARLAIWRAWRRDRRQRWERWLLAAFAADGLSYGFAGTLFLPVDGVYRALMLATIAAIAGVGQIVVAAHSRGAAWFVLPLVLPVLVVQLFAADRIGLFAALGLTVFLLIIGRESRKATANALDTLRLRFSYDDLAKDRARALQEAQHLSAVKDRFLATMSHELRTPLHGVLGLALLAQEASPPGSTAERHLVQLQRVGKHLLELINDVLDLSRIRSGSAAPERYRFDLIQLLDIVTTSSSVTAQEKGLRFELCHPFGSNEWVTGDATRVRQILLNLTGNAVKFTERGHVRLSARRDGVLVLFDVEDTGPGIPPAYAGVVFDAFRQVDETDQRRHGGAGLGLAVSQELAQAMGGSLELLPRSLSAMPGATFRLTLPLAPIDAPAEDRSDSNVLDPLQQGHVLVVEDNEVNAMIAETLLGSLGLKVTLAAHGEAAIRQLSEGRFSLILMDCQMPGMDGYEATRRIRELEAAQGRQPVPIVAVTAHGLEDSRKRSLDAGMNDHLRKPFSKEELARVVSKWQRPGPSGGTPDAAE